MGKTGLVKIPNVMEDGMCTEEFLGAFYRALGWSGKETLTARRVVINKGDWLSMCDKLKENDPSAALLMMNFGPSGREDVPSGKVRLEQDWMVA